MPKLMDQQVILPGVLQRTWLHTDGMGNDNITVESKQDVAPIIKNVKTMAQAESSKAEYKLVAQIPALIVEETARQCAKHWGVSVKKVFEEIMASKESQTDRAKAFWAVLCQGRDYRKLQARHYQ